MKLTLIVALPTAMMIASACILRADAPARTGVETVALIDKALTDAKP